MNKFELLLQRYNGGNFRGARAKLARDLDVTEATVGRWTQGGMFPSKDKLERMAILFGVSVDEVRQSLNIPKPTEMQKGIPVPHIRAQQCLGTAISAGVIFGCGKSTSITLGTVPGVHNDMILRFLK